MSPSPGSGALPSHQVCARVYLTEAAANNGQPCPICGRPLREHRTRDEPPERPEDDGFGAALATGVLAAEIALDTSLSPDTSSPTDPGPDFSGGGGDFSGGGAGGGW